MSRRVAIVGAGLAGLRCAIELRGAGIEPVIVESSDDVGGRVRTDAVGGFRLDRGFQVLLTAYPAARRALDLAALGLGAFRRGALVHRGNRLRRLEDPARSLGAIPAGLRSGVVGPADALRFAGLRRRLMRADPATLLRAPETTTAESLRTAGFGRRARESFLAPFLAGVLSESSLSTSSRLAEVYLRSFAAGEAALPTGGMGALPNQLRAELPESAVRLSEPAVRVDPTVVELASGEAVEADAVVLATDGVAAADLDESVGLEPWNPVTTFYFAAERPPVRGPWLVLDGDDSGPVNHLCVPSEVAPGYAPPGAALISATVVNPGESNPVLLQRSVRHQLHSWFGDEVAEWNYLRSYRIEHAVPFRPPGTLTPGGRPARLPSGVWCCGDHRDTPSIQGALHSGRRVAHALARELAAGRLEGALS